jgi:hypothetical protein
MAIFVPIGVLRRFPAAAYRRTPSCPVSGDRKPLCGLDQNKNCSFPNWIPINVHFYFMCNIYSAFIETEMIVRSYKSRWMFSDIT